MARPGDVIENPATGEKIIFRRTANETGGELLQFDMHVTPGGFVPAAHVHPGQTERFVLEKGALRLRKDGEERSYEAGEQAVVPPGTPHIWQNAGDDELRMRVDFTPAGHFDDFLTSLFALVRDGKTDEKGMPNPLQLAAMMRKYGDVIRPASPPCIVQKVLFGLLSPIAHRLGYRPDHPYPNETSALSQA